MSSKAGYTVVEISMEERTARVSERLTAEAVACRLASFPPADPLLYLSAGSDGKSFSSKSPLPFLPSRSNMAGSHHLRTLHLPTTLLQEVTPGLNDLERAKNTIVSALLQKMENTDDEQYGRRLSANDFTLVSTSLGDSSSQQHQPNPLSMSKRPISWDCCSRVTRPFLPWWNIY